MAAATKPTKQPPVNYSSKGAIACKGLMIDPANSVWIFTTDGTPGGTIGAGWAGIGSQAIDFTTGKTYSNRGTKAAPNWVEMSTA